MRIFVLLGVLLSSIYCKSQVVNDSGNHGLMLLTTKDSEKMNKITGTPYLEEDFKQGRVLVKGKEPLIGYLRFNVYEDQIEVKLAPQDEEVYLLPKNNNTQFEIGADNIVLETLTTPTGKITGYFIEHYNGEGLRLLEKPVAIVTEAVKAKTGYDKDKPARINLEEEYYVVADAKVDKVPLKHRHIKKMFKSRNAEEYLSKNKIRSEEDLVAFIMWLDKK